MDISDFKEIEVKRKPLSSIFNAAKLKKTFLFMAIGAAASFAWFYYTDGQHMDQMAGVDIFKSMALGSFFGLFISNSPCARGQC